MPVAGGLTNVIESGIRIERGNALFGEFEMVGTIEEALFRLGIGLDRASMRFQNLRRRYRRELNCPSPMMVMFSSSPTYSGHPY